MNTKYTPIANSIPGKVINFFAANPEEVLTVYDIAEKFDCVAQNVHTCLALAVKAGSLIRSRDDDGVYIYKQGKGRAILAEPGINIDAAHIVARKPAKKKMGSAARVSIDFATLKVEEGIPFSISSVNRGVSKWHHLFSMMTKPGQSVAIPAHARGAIGAAATKINRQGIHGKFRVALTDSGARVWRIA